MKLFKRFFFLFQKSKFVNISKINIVQQPEHTNSLNKQLVELPTVLINNNVPRWDLPLPNEYLVVSQSYLQEDWKLYGKFGHHTGTDYGGRKQTGVSIFACADGEIIYKEIVDSLWGKFLGNHAVLYVPHVDKSFLYCHMELESRGLGPIKVGEKIGIMGNTGKSAGEAIHLHLEGFHGKFNITQRSFISLDDIKTKTFDAHQFILSKIKEF